jgi:hypothetical protein
MIPRADLANIVQPIAAVDAPTALIAVADAKQEAFSRLAQIAVGQQLQAKVLSTYNDGSYLVRIANTAARMVLPSATRTGDNLVLTMVGKDPRPTFQLNETSTAAADEESSSVSLSAAGRSMEKDLQSLAAATPRGGAAAAVIGRDTLLPDSNGKTPLPENAGQAAPESTKTTLSNVGKLVDALLHASEESQLPHAIKPNAPLVTTPANTTQLAGALHDTIALSGVFYESHMAAWSEGKRPLALLQREPQAQLQQLQQQTLAQLGQQAATSSTDLLNSSDPVHTQLGQIVNLQLNTQEQQRVVWHGEVWPGQQMDWEINREGGGTPQHGSNGADDEAVPTWHSLMRFEFDHLGTVSASIRLVGQQIHMQLRTDNDIAAGALRTHGKRLSDAMQAAGSPLDSLIVKRDAEA